MLGWTFHMLDKRRKDSVRRWSKLLGEVVCSLGDVSGRFQCPWWQNPKDLCLISGGSTVRINALCWWKNALNCDVAHLKWLECSLFLLWLGLICSPSCQWTHFGIRSLQFSSLIPEFSHCLGKKIWGLTASLTCCVLWHNLSKRKRILFVFPLSVGLFRTVFPWMLRVTQLCCPCFSTVELFTCTL